MIKYIMILTVILPQFLLSQISLDRTTALNLDYSFEKVKKLDTAALNLYNQNINYIQMLNLNYAEIQQQESLISILKESVEKLERDNATLFNQNRILSNENYKLSIDLSYLEKINKENSEKILKLKASKNSSIAANIGLGGLILAVIAISALK